jgi:hypothetical protein
MSNYLDLSSFTSLWNPSFIRATHDWELESLDSFPNLLYSLNTHLGEVDSMLWTPSISHDFAVKSYYNMLHSGEHSSFPWKSIGRSRPLLTLLSSYRQKQWVESSRRITLEGRVSI